MVSLFTGFDQKNKTLINNAAIIEAMTTVMNFSCTDAPFFSIQTKVNKKKPAREIIPDGLCTGYQPLLP
jgi:hypothetical protein